VTVALEVALGLGVGGSVAVEVIVEVGDSVGVEVFVDVGVSVGVSVAVSVGVSRPEHAVGQKVPTPPKLPLAAEQESEVSSTQAPPGREHAPAVAAPGCSP